MKMPKIDSDSTVNISISGVWFAAWMFTVGYTKMTFGQGVVALFIWPYYLGAALGH